MNSRCLTPCFVALLAGTVGAAGPAAPTFQELMDPNLFGEPQCGMCVEGVQRPADAIQITTTGARIELLPAKREIRLTQRIGHDRPVAVVSVGVPLENPQVTHSTRGFVRLTLGAPKMTVRINGDSLLMLHAHEPLTVSVRSDITPAWSDSFGANHLIVDEWGGFGLYCSRKDLKDRFEPYEDPIAKYPLSADDVLWIGVCPPKPYDWDRSLRDHVVWHWSDKTGYPPDDQLRAWKAHGNIVLLQSEVMLWKDWNLDFVPRLGLEEFARVRTTLHGLGMRFIVYTSPYYFLKGTPIENKAMNSFDNFATIGFPPGWPTGENMELFMAAITKVMRDYKPDGLYFDGQYTENPPALYALARRTRSLIGEKGILEWHSTGALGPNKCYLPHADAYVDFVLRGEGEGNLYRDADYLRFFVSGYNIHNSVGVVCNNGPPGITPDLVRNALRVNARFHTIAGWWDNPASAAALKEYHARLTPVLRSTVDAEADQRQARIAVKAAAIRSELASLRNEPTWGKPVMAVTFQSVPEVARAVSAKNPEPFTVADGTLRVRALAHTHAFLRLPLKARAKGLVIRLRQGTDGGMSWGPAAMIRWSDGVGMRIGTRSDGLVQSDILGKQTIGGSFKTGEWVTLRVRWEDSRGVVESSTDGKTFQRLWTFEHGGALKAAPFELLIGKVPYNGQPIDHTEPGPLGESGIEYVNIYCDQ